MRKDLVEVVFVFDRSGSMASMFDAAVKGFNEYVEQQAADPGDVNISVYTFDNVIDRPLFRASLKDGVIREQIREGVTHWFKPRGSTALYDGMKHATDEVGAALALQAEDERPGKVMVVVITDGQENASRTATLEQIAAMVKTQRETYSWEYIFIGANQDAILTAAKFDIPMACALTYSANDAGLESSLESLTKGTRRYRGQMRSAESLGAVNYGFSQEDRKAAQTE